tara:strand:- start:73 stop:504 length:432 start_codon:yes stop_codon:yes gene_type:complete
MFFKKNKNENKNENFVKVSALMIHAARIDQDYSNKEEEIIKQTLLKIGVKKDDLGRIIEEGKKIDENSNQILNFTKEVKNMNEKNKIKIIEALWQIIYSNNDADMYETSLMRRLGGLLYIDSKTMGDIKDKIKKNIHNDLHSK